MGYESRIIVVSRAVHEFPNGNTWVYGDELARFNLCKMGYEMVGGRRFDEIFKTPIDFDLAAMPERWEEPDKEYSEEYYRQDCYGRHCCYTDIATVMAWLEKSEVLKEYRRAKLFYDFLCDLRARADEFGNLCIVHYGY